MHSSRSLVLSEVIFLGLLALGGAPADAQDPPSVAVGIIPSATYHGGDFDFVDMGTGRLNLHIPLVVDHSQRGELNFTYALSFSSTGDWTVVNSGNTWKVEPPGYGGGNPALIQEGQLGPLQLDHYIDDNQDHWNAFRVSENGFGGGPVHPMGTISAPGWGALMVSIDGSGIQSNNEVIRAKSGILGGMSEDTNGNEMTTSYTSSASTVTDTIGRAWTTTFSATLSGCPTGGPVAPTTASSWTVPGPANINGGTRTFKFCYSLYNIHTNFPGAFGAQYVVTATLLTGMVLPDGTTWRFDYDNSTYSYGDLLAVYTPTGGHILYTWATSGTSAGSICDATGTSYGPWLRVVTSRTVSDGVTSNTWNYALPQSPTLPYTVTDPLGNDTVYYPGLGCTIGKVKYYSGPAASGALLKTVTKTYRDLPDPYPSDLNHNVPDPQLLTSTTTTWANGQQSVESIAYDSGFTFTDFNPNWGSTGT